MCRADVHPAAAGTLASILREMRAALADMIGIDPEQISIGPVDFGEETTHGQ